MIVTPYSFVTAIIWFSLFIVISEILRRKIGFSIYCNINVLIVFITLSIARFCVPIELATTKIVDATIIFGFTKHFIQPAFTIANFNINWLMLLVALWVSGIAFCVLILISKIAKDKKVLQHLIFSGIKNERIEHFFKSNFQSVEKKCNLVISREIKSPMVTGLVTPHIILPESILEVSENSLHNVLTHEVTHVLNKDLWVKLLVELICCVMWFNPAVYLLRSSIDSSLELRCDYLSTRNMNELEKYRYLSTIMIFLKSKSPQKTEPLLSTGFQFLSITENFNIKQRFKLIGTPHKISKIKSFGFIFAMCICFILSYMVVFQPKHYPPIEDLIFSQVLTPDNSHIVERSDEIYWLVSDFGFEQQLSKNHLSNAIYSKFPIVNEEIHS